MAITSNTYIRNLKLADIKHYCLTKHTKKGKFKGPEGCCVSRTSRCRFYKNGGCIFATEPKEWDDDFLKSGVAIHHMIDIGRLAGGNCEKCLGKDIVCKNESLKDSQAIEWKNTQLKDLDKMPVSSKESDDIIRATSKSSIRIGVRNL